MKTLPWLLSAVLLVGSAASCGGPSPTTGVPGAATALNDFVGTWTGNWSEDTTTNTKLEGTVELNVDKDGKVTGKMTNKTLGMDGTVSGTVVEGGVTKASFVYPKATLVGEGRVGVKDGKLEGALDVKQGDSKAGTLRFTLSK